jgi:hypothetical protein
MEECAITQDSQIELAQDCRRNVLETALKKGCTSEDSGCFDFKECIDVTSDKAHCFFSCEDECAEEFMMRYGQEGCLEVCDTECSRLLELDSTVDDIQDVKFTIEDVGECKQLCAIANSCLSTNEIYEFNPLTNEAEVKIVTVGDETMKYIVEDRTRIALALEDVTTPEALKYAEYSAHFYQQASDSEFFSSANILKELGMGDEVGDLSEEEMLQLLQQMMMSEMMGGMYGDDNYGYGEGYGGYGDDIYGGFVGDSYEDDFEG